MMHFLRSLKRASGRIAVRPLAVSHRLRYSPGGWFQPTAPPSIASSGNPWFVRCRPLEVPAALPARRDVVAGAIAIPAKRSSLCKYHFTRRFASIACEGFTQLSQVVFDLQPFRASGRISEQSIRAHRTARERTIGAVLTKVRGILESVSEETLTLRIDAFEFEVLISEHTRRLVQS